VKLGSEEEQKSGVDEEFFSLPALPNFRSSQASSFKQTEEVDPIIRLSS
jgi:hypothetical protein